MKNLLTIIFLLLLYPAFSQEVQWASEIIDCSQTYKTEDYTNVKVLGEPDRYPFHPSPTASCYLFGWDEESDAETDDVAFVKVKFAKPQKANRVVVAENCNPGTITQVFLYDAAGKEYPVYEGKPTKTNAPKRLFQATFPFTNYEVAAVKVVGNPDAIKGWNGLDGIGISESAQPIVMEQVKENLGPNINSEMTENAPKISPDGKTLYFSVEGLESNIGMYRIDDDSDIYYTTLDKDGNWSERKPMGKPVSNETYNWPISISPDGNSLVVSNRYKSDGTRDGRGVSIAQRKIGGWKVPKSLEIKDFENKAGSADYFLSNDLQVLFSAIKTKGTKGDHDIHISFREPNGSYTKPLNIGFTVNTKGDDVSPVLASDGITMYFSSDGHKGGFGNNDIWMTKRLDDTWTNWSTPVNLGADVNTEDYDSDFCIDAKGEYAYLASYDDSYGGADIHRVKLKDDTKPEPVVLIYGKVYDSKTKATLAADVLYDLLPEGKLIGTANSDPNNGEYKIVLPFGKRYSFMAKSGGYYSINENIDLTDLKEYTEIERDLYLAPIEVGEVIRLNNIFFEFGKADLKEDSFKELDDLVKLLNENKTMRVALSGHTDNVGSDQDNLNLSQGRIDSVAAYLAEKGIDKSRFEAKGYGESSPVATNDTDEGRALNRRVEFKILSL